MVKCINMAKTKSIYGLTSSALGAGYSMLGTLPGSYGTQSSTIFSGELKRFNSVEKDKWVVEHINSYDEIVSYPLREDIQILMERYSELNINLKVSFIKEVHRKRTIPNIVDLDKILLQLEREIKLNKLI